MTYTKDRVLTANYGAASTAYAASGAANTDAFDEAYTYDNLNRLGNVTRDGGILQNWGLDALGNWSTFTDTAQGLVQQRDSNTLNEITAISATTGAVWITPEYDAHGNQISGPVPGDETRRQFYVYDGWNRLVAVKAASASNANVAGDIVATYQYDGRGFRIQKTVGTGTNAVTSSYYQNAQNQLLEVRQTAGAATQVDQYVWSVRYIDAAVLVYSNVNASGVAAQTIYFVQDANFNVTALVDGATGAVLARKVYTPYGTQTLLTGDWLAADLSTLVSTIGSAAVNTLTNGPGFQGLFRDAETGLLYSRARYTNSSLGVFMTPEPSGGTPYTDGINLYVNRGDNPIKWVDPSGLFLTGCASSPSPGSYLKATALGALQWIHDQHKGYAYYEGDGGWVTGLKPLIWDKLNAALWRLGDDTYSELPANSEACGKFVYNDWTGFQGLQIESAKVRFGQYTIFHEAIHAYNKWVKIYTNPDRDDEGIAYAASYLADQVTHLQDVENELAKPKPDRTALKRTWAVAWSFLANVIGDGGAVNQIPFKINAVDVDRVKSHLGFSVSASKIANIYNKIALSKDVCITFETRKNASETDSITHAYFSPITSELTSAML